MPRIAGRSIALLALLLTQRRCVLAGQEHEHAGCRARIAIGDA